MSTPEICPVTTSFSGATTSSLSAFVSFLAVFFAIMSVQPTFLSCAYSFSAILLISPFEMSNAYLRALAITGAPDALDIIRIFLLKPSPIPGPYPYHDTSYSPPLMNDENIFIRTFPVRESVTITSGVPRRRSFPLITTPPSLLFDSVKFML